MYVFRLSVYLSKFICVTVSLHFLVFLSVYVFLTLCVCPSVCLSVCLSVFLFICMTDCPSLFGVISPKAWKVSKSAAA